jgi:signal peptidase II
VNKSAARMFGAATFLVIVDQLIKFLVVTELKGKPAISLIGPLNADSDVSVLRFVFVSNTGAAFGLGSNFTFVISLIAIAVVIGLSKWMLKITDPIWMIAATLLLGGALGNLVDRVIREPQVLRGYVVDFISIGKFPVFNFADICITLAAVVMIYAALTKREPEGLR